MRVFLSLFMFCSLLFSAELREPYKVIEADSHVLSSSLIDGVLYLGTDSGRVNIYNIKDDTFSEPIILSKIKTHFTDDEFAKVFSIDELDGRLMVLSETSYGKRILHIFETIDGVRKETRTIKLQNESIKKALFLDANTALVGSLSNELYFIDLSSEQIKFTKKFSIASLSDFELSKDRNMVAVGCESGIVYIYEPKSNSVLNELSFHKDNMYDIDYKNGAIITGGVDRHAGVYIDSTYMMKSNFLVYAVALSSDAKYGAFMSDELSDVDVFDTKTRDIFLRIKTAQSTLNGIHFLDNDTLITVAYEKKVKFWRIR
ncbi:MAG: WD40 repeat domain-containing protein [Wolinella sp.]